MRRVTLLLLSAVLCACGKEPPPKSSAENFDRSIPHWEDAFDRVPEILVLVRPQALRRDPVYGPLLKTVSALAAARGPSGGGGRAVEAFESADEVVVGISDRAHDDVLIVLSGVRPDIDPEKLADESGVPLWSARARLPGQVSSERARTPELVRLERAGGPVLQSPASLFVLPQRTWVVAVGDARSRAREAFANPFGRPAPVKDDTALLFVRLDGPGLVAWIPRLRARGGVLEPIGRMLQWVTIALHPAKEGVQIAFSYSDEGAAAFAEMTLGQIVEAYGRGTNPRAAWLGSAKIERAGRVITARVALPRRLLEELPKVAPSELGL